MIETGISRMIEQQQSRLEEVVHHLKLLAELPNKRSHPATGDLQGDFDYWFDGGAVKSVTGSTQYKFATGATASRAVLPFLSLGLELADGTRVHVQSPDNRPVR